MFPGEHHILDISELTYKNLHGKSVFDYLNKKQTIDDWSNKSHSIAIFVAKLINLDSRISPCNGTAFYLLLSSLLERLINADTIMSPQVGQAGKRLFEFFERRWEQLAPNMD